MLAAVEAERATKLFCPPTVWIALMNHPDFDRRDLSSLRKGYYGASIMPVEVLAELGERLPGVRLFNFYGQTEMSPVATVLRPEDQVRKAGSAGRPALSVETLVVDDDGNPVPAGEVGEIVHRSPQAMLGYWNDPAKTAETFRGGWLHTGDLGILDDEGYLYVVDRMKDMIKSGGENVASREVEEVIHAHPAVAEAAVFAIPHPRWIEAVAAVVVPRAGADVAPEAITALLPRAPRRLQDPQVRRRRRRAAQEPERKDPQARAAHDPRRPRRVKGEPTMSTIAVIDHGVHGDRAVERRVLEPLGYEVIDTQDLGLDRRGGLRPRRRARGGRDPRRPDHPARPRPPRAPDRLPRRRALRRRPRQRRRRRRRGSRHRRRQRARVRPRGDLQPRDRAAAGALAQAVRVRPLGAAGRRRRAARRSRSRGCRARRSGSSASAASAATWRARRRRSASRSSRYDPYANARSRRRPAWSSSSSTSCCAAPTACRCTSRSRPRRGT